MVQKKRQREKHPIPIIDLERCDGCGLCLRVCPTGALAMNGSKALVARPGACDYSGLCEMACPVQAIQRPFEIVLWDSSIEE